MRRGKCLEQVIGVKPIPWSPLPNPWTLAGDEEWTDYDLSVDVYLPGAGEAALIGRIDSADVFRDSKALWPSGYVLTLDADGKWNLASYMYKKPTVELGSGASSARGGSWHHVTLGFRGDVITATVDGHPLAAVHDTSHKQGMMGIGGGWNSVQFDTLSVSAAGH
jgi:hypothetical protein